MRPETNIILLFSTRIIRLFAYGLLSVVLVFYLVEIGLSTQEMGLLLTVTLLGDTLISLFLTTTADRFGRKSTLILSSLLITFAGILFISTHHFVVLLIAAVIGVISPSGNEIGPFLPIEQAALSQLIPNERRTHVFAWYNFAGSLATATGALIGGLLVRGLHEMGLTALDAYRIILISYAMSGVLLAGLFTQLSPLIEVPVTAVAPSQNFLGLHQSQRIVAKLSTLFALDAFAGGFIIQSVMAYWFYLRFGADIGVLGAVFFGANILAGLSALLASRIAVRIGLINTMVFTHIPSNILLILIPFMPNLSLAIILLLLRFSISQMDVPTRQSYTMAVVNPNERSAAAGVTGIARSVGAALSPTLAGGLLANPVLLNVPFLLAGSLKIVYDILLYVSFKAVKPPEEKST